MKKSICMSFIALAVIALAGCQNLGNGQLDIPVEISVEYQDNFGNTFIALAGPDGLEIQEAYYKSAKTGAIYEVTEEGGFLITAPDGVNKIRIKKAAITPDDQAYLDGLAADLETMKALGAK